MGTKHVVVLVSALSSGCAGNSASDEALGQGGDSLRAGQAPEGTYHLVGAAPSGTMRLLVMSGADAQCHTECRGSCAMEGDFCRVTRWGSERFISFYDDMGAFETRFKYTYAAGALHVAAKDGHSYEMQLGDSAYCIDDTWCEHQHIACPAGIIAVGGKKCDLAKSRCDFACN
jgi:hypothetical protein